MPKTSLVLTVATLALLTIPAHLSAQTPVTTHFTITSEDPQQLGPFRQHDVLTLKVTLRQIGPVSSCVVAPILVVDINYNNGLHMFTIFRDLNVTETRSFILDEDNGFLDAYIRCPSAVEGDLTVTLQPFVPEKWTPEMLTYLNLWATRFSGLGIVTGAASLVCVYVPGQFGVLCGTGLRLASLAMAASAWLVNKAMQDPSDPNFTVIAQPVPIVLPAGMDCGNFPECNNLTANFLQVISLSRAILMTNDRVQGAIDAGDTFWQSVQEQTRRQYQIQLATLVSQNAVLLQTFQTAFQNNLAAAGGTPMVVSATDIATQQAATQAGWTFDQQQVFTAIGFSPQEQDAIAAFQLGQDTSTLGGDYPELLTSGDFYPMVAGFITAMGDGTQPIPAPPVSVNIAMKFDTINRNSNRRITVALLSNTTFTATQVAQNTITFGRTGIEAPPLSCNATDFNNDGMVDFVCLFSADAAPFQPTDTTAKIKFVYHGARFTASAPITVTH
jgi:hypothetical protein